MEGLSVYNINDSYQWTYAICDMTLISHIYTCSLCFFLMASLTLIVDCLPIVILFSVLHLTVLPYLCSDLAYSVYFRGNTNNSEDEMSLVSPLGGEKRDQSRMRILIQTSERRGDYMKRTILSVRRELSLARDSHQVYLCSADNKDFTEIPEMPELTVVQPCKQNRKWLFRIVIDKIWTCILYIVQQPCKCQI